MEENRVNINNNSRVPLSRNAPVALVVGVGGFLGSYLAQELLSKNIQVVGVDDFKTGKRGNLEKAVRDKNFHLIVSSMEDFKLDLPRLDYLFMAIERGGDVANILKVFKEKKCRLLLISSIGLYSSEIDSDLKWYKETEVKIASAASENHLNARILRLGAVYGPGMNFTGNDPIIRLIQAALNDQLQKDIPLEFSTRALYITDAIDLIIKSMLAGATAQKIFDGVLPVPIQIAEVKQVLLDPIWYENKNFTPTELPPWRTPNLEKTIKFLNWQPKTELVGSLKKTLHFFKEEGAFAPKVLEEPETWNEEKQEQLQSLKPDKKEDKVEKKKREFGVFKYIYFLVALILVTYSLIWPIFSFGMGVFIYQYNLNKASQSLEKGNLDESLISIRLAQNGIEGAKAVVDSFVPLKRLPFLKNQFLATEQLLDIGNATTGIAQNISLGLGSLYQGLKSVTGEINEPSKEFFEKSQLELASADQNLAMLETKLGKVAFIKTFPQMVQDRLNNLKNKLTGYKTLVEKGRAISILLPEIVSPNGEKNYLVLLQNNAELRPGGGFIGSVAKINFDGGKLKKIVANDVYALDGQLTMHVEPPKEIKEDLGQKDWYLRDSNWEADFPTAARQAEWFYTKETGETVQGVIALDLSAASDLLGSIGSLDLPDYNEKITADNLFEKAVTHAESGFFPGSQAKKTFLTALVDQLFNKLFFLPQTNWPAIVASLGRSLEGKHISIYLNDPRLFSYIVSQNWVASLPRVADAQEGSYSDLLVPVEANLGANKANFYLDRSYNLDTTIGKEGDIKHRLRITYLNRSPSDTFPAGKYKNRMRIYLPFGSKLTRALLGESDITKDVTPFVDYGRSGFSFLIEIAPKERKSLILDYSAPANLIFKDNMANYRLDVIKQAGTLKDAFEWHLSFPINYKLHSKNGQVLGPQEQVIITDLSTDRSFEVVFKK